MVRVTDKYEWLEDVTGDAALEWVRARNERTVDEFTANDEFRTLETDIRSILDTDARIPYARKRGDHLYNFWKDASHPRGLWRRTTMKEYRKDSPAWDVIIDLDALAEAEGENWVWKSAQVLRPSFDRALISLSRGGADASVIREYSLTSRSFVAPDEGGFVVPEAKTDIDWIDADTVFVGTDLGPGSLTDSGYPRRAHRWLRGTPLAEAPVVYEGEQTDVAVSASHDATPGFERSLVQRATDFFNAVTSILHDDGSTTVLDVPTDASVSLHENWLTVRLTTAWTVDGTEYAAGSLVAAKIDEFLSGARDLVVVFAPDARTSLHQYAWTENHLLMVLLEDVRSSVHVVTLGDTVTSERLQGLPDAVDVTVIGTDPEFGGDEYFLDASGHLTPSTLLVGTVGTEPEALKSAPAFFDTTGLAVEQYFATSLDGTRVPYFVVRNPGTQDRPTAAGPTLLYGYGGFEVSLTPSYSGVVGAAWLARGGTYVVANIRGGGEYGPSWHTEVLKSGRHKVHEDFAAVASDLVERGITTPDQLGAQGGSNGGLLMGIMLTKYPESFGAIVCQVPLLDMKRYHRLLAGASWMAEYGDPDDPDEWAFISEYSPYQNVSPPGNSIGVYPPILITTSTRDDRVHPGHARKMDALLEEYGYDVSYYENIEGGHGGAADNAQAAFKSALAYTFLWRTLGGGTR
ncbi:MULTISPECIES: prolyl oligopeptidase family serine peptidase [unclassified Rhodococcus (in: high G+C Gram-positive bacteria)]|uniref:prolyl oligopeptidase family serine peptidase n=1 Tax=unclassified Rhodococcus (in: high G+C Gram-positive bacteria) TaxID=192944 RepID=UPI0006FECFA4|nr:MULTISPECIES: prolyl oligopeptidase family serine peptidase [unclassified Rhodococcus (in: high G+C Gram-positive bacteria)]KQU36205.1 prolyl oligopeptidase [Rhodococcus sp. Leaf225]KQU48753.1 prolyl oligopeptidase [Rhodococcus sp. Leaf258]